MSNQTVGNIERSEHIIKRMDIVELLRCAIEDCDPERRSKQAASLIPSTIMGMSIAEILRLRAEVSRLTEENETLLKRTITYSGQGIPVERLRGELHNIVHDKYEGHAPDLRGMLTLLIAEAEKSDPSRLTPVWHLGSDHSFLDNPPHVDHIVVPITYKGKSYWAWLAPPVTEENGK